MRNLLRKSAQPQNVTKILIAILFSLIAVVGGFTDQAYVPLSAHKAIDVTIVAVVFATLIGGYGVGVPLALVWSIVTHFNVDPNFRTWPFWAILVSREIFVVGTIYMYDFFRKLYYQSPMNVYRAVAAGILIRNLIGVPIDMMYRHNDWLLLRGEQFIIELALCCVFMSLLIKHLRQIHILNGVRKKEKGMKRYEGKDTLPR